MSQTNVNIRMDSEIKKEADALFKELGMNMSIAVNVFVRQAVRQGGLPFEVSTAPNAETIAAMQEADRLLRDPTAKRYTSVDALFADLDSDTNDI